MCPKELWNHQAKLWYAHSWKTSYDFIQLLCAASRQAATSPRDQRFDHDSSLMYYSIYDHGCPKPLVSRVKHKDTVIL